MSHKTNSNALANLQHWYKSMCNGDWEHTYGVSISNIDNPGWSLKVELVDTPLYERVFEGINLQRNDENDWLICSVNDGVFQGYGGPLNLDELIDVFMLWAKSGDEEVKKKGS